MRDPNTYPIDLTIRGEGPPIIVGLQRNGSTVSVDGDVDQAIAVAQWYRQEVPPEQQLVFFDQEYTGQVELTPESSAEQLAAPFKAT